ncbi:MAG TPA: hypothetical protein VMS55_09495 [Myxococcota bacterium]|nr:hypothetical protein [Myxococcota bacterium]
MATTAELPAKRETTNRRPLKRPTDRFGGSIPMALGAIAVTLLGFWRTFFSQLGKVDAAHRLHGALATGWLVLVLVQASLIGSRRYKWHRILGWTSVPVFALLVATSCYMLVLMFSATGGMPIPFETAKIFGYSDVTALPLLIIVYASAIILRRDRHIHSRLISITLLAGLLPALARAFFGILVVMGIAGTSSIEEVTKGLILAMHPTYISVLLVLAIAIFVDWKKARLRWPFPFAFAWVAINYATFFLGMSSRWFDRLARAIASMA